MYEGYPEHQEPDRNDVEESQILLFCHLFRQHDGRLHTDDNSLQRVFSEGQFIDSGPEQKGFGHSRTVGN